MRRRAEHVDTTRRRIVEAAVRLHTTIGPANTSIAGVAEEAGVTRLTVYRHFGNIEELFRACRADWYAQNTPPDPAEWREIADPDERYRVAFERLYGWFRAHDDELYPIYRDAATMPDAAQQAIRDQVRGLADSVLGTPPTDEAAARRLSAVAGHLVNFWTWWSLTHDQGLADAEVTDLAVRLLRAAA